MSALGQEKITDDWGVARLYVPRRFQGKEAPVHIFSYSFEIDTTFLLRITNPTELRVSPPDPDLPLTKTTLPQKKNDALTKKQKLEEAERLINELEKDLAAYLNANPGSAMANFFKVFGFRREEVESLKKRLLILISRYQDILDHTGDDQILDLTELNENQLTIKNDFNLFLSKLNSTENTYRSVKNAQPSFSLKTDIFFQEREYLIQQLTPDQQDELERIIGRVKRALDEDFSEYAPEDYVFEIWTTGYTDGKPVGEKLDRAIQPLCPGEYQSADGNNCLSFLRAKEIAGHLEGLLRQYGPASFPEGLGSVLAKGNTSANGELRKCVVSFSIIPHSINKNSF